MLKMCIRDSARQRGVERRRIGRRIGIEDATGNAAEEIGVEGAGKLGLGFREERCPFGSVARRRLVRQMLGLVEIAGGHLVDFWHRGTAVRRSGKRRDLMRLALQLAEQPAGDGIEFGAGRARLARPPAECPAQHQDLSRPHHAVQHRERQIARLGAATLGEAQILMLQHLSLIHI